VEGRTTKLEKFYFLIVLTNGLGYHEGYVDYDVNFVYICEKIKLCILAAC
jgi:hypothetical protein